jgi:hypothetical protein
LYDPKTGTFRPTGSKGQDRSLPTAALLPDGRVLIAGGWDDSASKALTSAELYDPRTDSFSSTASMASARNDYTATLLSDGRVLVVGGDDGSGAIASAELYQQ